MKRAAVVIGVDRTGTLTPLQSAAVGASKVANWLSGEGYDVTCLTDAKDAVTQDQVKRAIRSYVTVPATYELLLVYFSGHGYWHARSDLWLLSGAPADASEVINLRTAMDLAKYSGIPNVVFVSDACRSLPDSRSGASLEGAPAFPNLDDFVSISKIDSLKATSESTPAWEGKIAGQPQSVLTAAWMAAYENPDPDMIRRVRVGAHDVEVVPNRRLEPFIQRKVDELVALIEPDATQTIEINVPSADDVFVARVRRSAAPASSTPANGGPGPVPVAPRPDPAATIVARSVTDALSAHAQVSTGDGANLDAEIETKLRSRMPDPTVDHYESGCGFVVAGAIVGRAAVVPGTKHALAAAVLTPGHESGSPGLVRVERVSNGPSFVPSTVPHDCAATVAIDLGAAGCVLLPALPGFIAHVEVKSTGVSTVSYVPSSNGPAWGEYSVRRAELDRLRAMVALAVDRDVFHLRTDAEADALASRIRLFKGMDPTLGLYAAHAFSQAGNDVQVNSVLNAMRPDLMVDLFDVRLLARRRASDVDREWRVVPACPLLSQAWNLLSTRPSDISPLLRRMYGALRPSLWTTFQASATDEIMKEVDRGGLR